MNRRERRAAVARGSPVVATAPVDDAALFAEAELAFRSGQTVRAEALCKRILARKPRHVASLNLLGLIAQASARHRQAVKMFAQAIAANEYDAACHYNVGSSYQLLGERSPAARHFAKAIALGLGGKNAEHFMLQAPHVIEGVQRAMEEPAWPRAPGGPFDARLLAAIAGDLFLQCALRLQLIRGAPLEFFLTRLRAVLLAMASADEHHVAGGEPGLAPLFCALAEQCFINEYVFAAGEEEWRQAGRLRQVLRGKISAGSRISPLLLAAVAAYFPLHALAEARLLLASDWPDCALGLLRRQAAEPLEEAKDRGAIPALTALDEPTSIEVGRQYEENPYPRWTLHPLVVCAGATGALEAHDSDAGPQPDILVAGCGTGQHVFDVKEQWPRARVLAVDISRASLAYARRKTREAGLRGVEYAQADLLKLPQTARRFDRIESVGVLHHLRDPQSGFRALLAMLRPGGLLRLGLYSEAARRTIVDARTLAAERGYRARAEDIRALRQTIMRDAADPRWRMLLDVNDFYSMSGCRDMLFNVMEHRFTIPGLAALIDEHRLSFLGFELPPAAMESFRRRHPDEEALTDLAAWHAFETANPHTFRYMYVFSVRRAGSRQG